MSGLKYSVTVINGKKSIWIPQKSDYIFYTNLFFIILTTSYFFSYQSYMISALFLNTFLQDFFHDFYQMLYIYIYIYIYIERERERGAGWNKNTNNLREREELSRCTKSYMNQIKKTDVQKSHTKSYMTTDLCDFARDFKSRGKLRLSHFFRQYKSYILL